MRKVAFIFAIFTIFSKILGIFLKNLLLGYCKKAKKRLEYNQLKGNLVGQKTDSP
jgi:hypothetical protein